MNQHITVEQLNELSLKSLWKFGQWFGMPTKESTIGHKVEIAELTTIGKMIEFFDGKCNLKLDQDLKYWTVKTSDGRFFQHFELCDALWEACKQVLEVK